MAHPEYFLVTFVLKDRKPPLSIFRLFGKGNWRPTSNTNFEVRAAGMTAASLTAAISKHLKAGETVYVSAISNSQLQGAQWAGGPWESTFQRQKESRRLQSRIRQAKRRQRHTP